MQIISLHYFNRKIKIIYPEAISLRLSQQVGVKDRCKASWALAEHQLVETLSEQTADLRQLKLHIHDDTKKTSPHWATSIFAKSLVSVRVALDIISDPGRNPAKSGPGRI